MEQSAEPPDEAYAVSLGQLLHLAEGLPTAPAEGQICLGCLECCLARPAALAASFRRGGSGAQDYSAIAGAIAALVAPTTPDRPEASHRAEVVMEALSAAIWQARPRRQRAPGCRGGRGCLPEAQDPALPEEPGEAQGRPPPGAEDAVHTEGRQDGDRWGSWEQGWAREGAAQRQEFPLQQPQQQPADDPQAQEAAEPEAGEVGEEEEELEELEEETVGDASNDDLDEALQGTVAAANLGDQPAEEEQAEQAEEGDPMEAQSNGELREESPELAADEAEVLVPGDAGMDCEWLLAALAAALPLLEGALPKDERGECVLPHQHRMKMVQADLEGMPVRFWGTRAVYVTSKICDRCMEPIVDRVFYHCSGDCDVDFCEQCHEELQQVLDKFFDGPGSGQADQGSQVPSPEHMVERMLWAVHAADEIARLLLFRSAEERMKLGRLLAFEWPVDLFARLVGAVVDVCNAKMLYNATQGAMTTFVRRSWDHGAGRGYFQEVCPIYKDRRFWCSVGLLQFLSSCNGLPREQVLDGHGVRGPRIPPQDFVLEGINKCRPEVEWHHWLRHPVTRGVDLLRTPIFKVSRSFRSLVAHSNLLPISFRRRCLLADVRCQMDKDRAAGHGAPLRLHVEREPTALVEAVVEAFRRPEEPPAPVPSGPEADAWQQSPVAAEAAAEAATSRLRRPLSVIFGGEAGQGPGVRREFFQVAMRAFLAALFSPAGNRTYWFAENVDRPEAYFAFGVLLGQAVLHDVLIPNLFPWTLFDLLLRDLRSPHATERLGLAQLAAVSQEQADSLQKVLNYEGEDIGEVFGELGWERTGTLEGQRLTQATKAAFVSAYVHWSLVDRIWPQFGPLSAGFQAVVGSSVMVQRMVDADHLERIVCGGEVPVDIPMLRRKATHQGWEEDDQAYLESFWALIGELTEASKRRFLVFVTASDRVPLRGWEELRLTVQKNGSGDERLPTAYTCFCLLLLPRYTSTEALRRNMLQAVMNSEGFGLN